MKKLIILIFTLLIYTMTASSQVRLNFKLGISPGVNPHTNGIIVNRQNPHEEFKFNMVHVLPQFYGGILASLEMRTPFFLECGITYTEKKSNYQVDYRITRELNPGDQVMSETERMILLPVNIGVSLGSLDITSGLTAMKTISNADELTHLNGFRQDKNNVKLGWQTGVRYAILRMLIGVEFQGSLNVVGQGMYVNEQPLDLRQVPGNLVISIQYGLSKK